MAEDSEFEVMPAREMQNKYHLYAGNRPEIKLNPDKVPPGLRHLIPLAEKFGVSDDLIRRDVAKKALPAELAELHRLVEESEKLLMEWLAGPAADGPRYSDEYIAFSAMMMAHDGC